MFSSTTIASSMTMPTESVSASIVSMLSVKPMYQISAKVAMIEVGIEMAAMIVERKLPRNSSTTSAARIEPTTGAPGRCAIDASMNSRLVADDAQRRSRAAAIGLELLEPLLDVVDDLDGVGARLLADLQQHRGARR